MMRCSGSLFSADYRSDDEWRAIFGSSVDLTDCLLNIQEIFGQKMATDSEDADKVPDVSFSSECDVSSIDSYPTKFATSECDSGLFSDLDRCSVWRNSSSSTSTNSSSSATHQSSPTSSHDAPDAPTGYRRSTSAASGSKLHFVIDEIIRTEKNYVRDLQEISEGYIRPMRNCACFTPDDVDQVFGNLEQILQLHSAFYAALLPPDLAGPGFIATTFLEFADQFQIYTDYCTNYPSSLKHLAHLLSQYGLWFRQRQQELNHPLPLAPFLLKPVQRILKYHLLLQKLIDCCDAELDDHRTLVHALETMKGMANHINEYMQQRERQVRLEQLQVMLVDLPEELDLENFGPLLLEDSFHVKSSKKTRHFFLFENGLLIVKIEESGSLGFKNYITHSNMMLSEVIADNPLQFSVIPFDNPNPKLMTVVECRNLEQKKVWTTKLKELMIHHYGADIPAHVRDLVMQLGAAAQERATSSPRRFRPFDILTGNAAPEYLRKRRTKSPGRPYSTSTSSSKFYETSDASPSPDTRSLSHDNLLPTKAQERKNSKGKSGKTSKFVRVSTDYIPKTKDDEIMFEETRKAVQVSIGDRERKGSIEISQETLSTSNPDRIGKSPAEPSSKREGRGNRYKTFFGMGETFTKAYSQMVKPIFKSIGVEAILPDRYLEPDFVDGQDVPSSIPQQASMDETRSLNTEGTSENSVQKASSSSDLTQISHPKLRRLAYDHSDSVLEAPATSCSIKRKAAIKRRASAVGSKSAPGTPVIGEQQVSSPKPLPSAVKDRIKMLEELAKQREETNAGGDEKKLDRYYFGEFGMANETWVAMMVKKIETGAQMIDQQTTA